MGWAGFVNSGILTDGTTIFLRKAAFLFVECIPWITGLPQLHPSKRHCALAVALASPKNDRTIAVTKSSIRRAPHI